MKRHEKEIRHLDSRLATISLDIGESLRAKDRDTVDYRHWRPKFQKPNREDSMIQVSAMLIAFGTSYLCKDLMVRADIYMYPKRAVGNNC
ncbi:hypothetical protein N7447_001604 [Penicillium robsamsonii]|uniref:uncharacterized protein n=1 Tax=Penicillium robsamsonii TaxID=1792511 RepID=UPI00254792A8|nr:uncharacterized protein N7447_001604 [Penicillium robsamsonii]KAJ5835578.1 hypothetical protein N7447_001604 [Penicillium robsamsonii]